MKGLLKFGSGSVSAALSVFVSFFLLLPSSVHADVFSPITDIDTAEEVFLQAGMPVFDEALSILLSGEDELDKALVLLEGASNSFEDISNSAARTYLLGRVAFLRGQISLADGNDRKEARGYFEETMMLADESLLSSGSSESWRLKADAASSWMLTKGLGGIIKMAPDVQEWSDNALSLDPRNPLAIIINAQGQINAPRSAGGDPAEAARRLGRLVERDDLDSVALFRGRYSLAQAYRKLKDDEMAEYWCEMASRIFPGNPMLEDCPG